MYHQISCRDALRHHNVYLTVCMFICVYMWTGLSLPSTRTSYQCDTHQKPQLSVRVCPTCMCTSANVYYQCVNAHICILHVYSMCVVKRVTLRCTSPHSHWVSIAASLLAALANYSWEACWLSFPTALGHHVHTHGRARDAPSTTPRQRRLDRHRRDRSLSGETETRLLKSTQLVAGNSFSAGSQSVERLLRHLKYSSVLFTSANKITYLKNPFRWF